MPLPRIRLEQREHHRVIRIPVIRQGIPHDAGKMKIPHGHRIRRPMTPLHNLRRGPGPHPGHQLKPSLSPHGIERHGLLKPRSFRTARRTVEALLLSTPARCHSQDGINAQVRGAGMTYIRSGAGPGAGSPNFRTSNRHAR